MQIRKGIIEGKEALLKAEEMISEFPLVIDDNPEMKIDDLVKYANKYVQDEGSNIIFIDNMNLISVHEKTVQFMNRFQKSRRG